MEENLLNERKVGWEKVEEDEKQAIFHFADEYMYFLNKSKTEREAVCTAVDMLQKNNFKNIEDVQSLNAEDKVYYINHSKSIYMAVIGEEKLENGLNIVGAHIDSPRLDLKPNPLYEDTGFAYLKTHYYGGIKKYQWTAIPLSIHGVIVKPSGEKITVNIGEDETDPIFTITDLLPHLATEQME